MHVNTPLDRSTPHHTTPYYTIPYHTTPQQSSITCASAHLEVKLLFTEPKILSGHKATQENVDTFSHRERHGNHTVRRRCAVQYANVICAI